MPGCSLPLAVVALFGAAWGITSRAPPARHALRRRTLPPFVGALGGLAIGVLAGARTPFAVAVVCGCGALVASGVRWGRRVDPPMLLAHLGFAVLLVGIAGSTQAERTTVTLTPGGQVELGGVVLEHRSVAVEPGDRRNTEAVVATLAVVGEGGSPRSPSPLRPALVAYPERSLLLAETDLHSTWRRDVHAVLRTATDDGAARYDLAVTPLVQFVWGGATMISAAAAWVAIRQSRSRRRASRRRSSNADIVADSSALAASASAADSRSSSSASDAVGPDGVVGGSNAPRSRPTRHVGRPVGRRS